MGWFARHWPTVAGVGSLLLPAWKGVSTLLMRGGDIDFVISRTQEPGWFGHVIGFLADPPSWIILPLIVGGLLLIRWDYRRAHNRPPLASAAAIEGAPPPAANRPAAPLYVSAKTARRNSPGRNARGTLAGTCSVWQRRSRRSASTCSRPSPPSRMIWARRFNSAASIVLGRRGAEGGSHVRKVAITGAR